MTSSFNIDHPQSYFKEINIKVLPGHIKNEFEKIFELYESRYIITPNIDMLVAFNKDIFRELEDLLTSNDLFVSIHDNLIFKEEPTIKYGFEELKHNNLNYYNFKGKEYFYWFVNWTYCEAFHYGYNYKFKSDYEIFSTANLDLSPIENLFEENYPFKVLSHNYFNCFGEKEGKFIKAWDEILNRPYEFEKMFDGFKDLYISRKPFQWEGNNVETIELIKGIIESGKIKGKQKDIFSSFETFFNIKLNNIDKTIQDIKKRNNGSETIFIDKIKSSLCNFITKEIKRQ